MVKNIIFLLGVILGAYLCPLREYSLFDMIAYALGVGLILRWVYLGGKACWRLYSKPKAH
ncbi:hypothetical protein CTA21_16275 [Salmonella enterica]|nr:hypothetical protein [Salmonella enterica]EDZ0839910.1 hypothetical protein [Salmonella enterica subsp. enterica serovar Saintpaul]EEC1302908.1 hypothetical protein [Salmonella enterica]